MASKYMKVCSTSLAIREIQITTTMRYHYTSIRMAKIKNNKTTTTTKQNTKHW